MSKQLDGESKKYRNGFEYIYNVAKINNLIIIFISFLISILSLVNSINKMGIENYITFFSFMWFLAGIVLKKNAASNRKKAADLQELYDVYIMDIPKNDKIIALDKINYIIKRSKKEYTEKYYDINDECLKIRDIFLVQKGNIIYDKIMRTIYLYVNWIVIMLCILTIVIFSLYNGMNIFNTVIVVMFPSINILNYFINNILCLKNEINQINKLHVCIDNSIRLCQSRLDSENINEIRQYQDFIYLKRKNWTMVPNYIYKLYLKLKKYFYQINQESYINSDSLQNEAINIESELGIINFLSNFGRAEIVGSVANDLIVNKDIDIHLLTNNNVDDVAQKFIGFLEYIKEIRSIKIEDYKLEKKSVCVVIDNYNNWNIEVWITSDINYTGFKMKEELKKRLDDDKRDTIISLKKYYNEKDLLHGEMSSNIYRAVLYNNINNIDEFKEYTLKRLEISSEI